MGGRGKILQLDARTEETYMCTPLDSTLQPLELAFSKHTVLEFKQLLHTGIDEEGNNSSKKSDHAA